MTIPSEKFCLKWNDFQLNIRSSYEELRKNLDFSDVTLLCEEDQQMEAHRIILTACSPFFSSVLKRANQSHPIIYMRGLKAKDLGSILDFIYHGEANIYQADLDGFLALAEELQLKGLSGPKQDNKDSIHEYLALEEPNWKKANTKQYLDQAYISSTGNNEASLNNTINRGDIENKSIVPVYEGKMDVASNTTEDELNAKIQSLMEKVNDIENSWRCAVCEKETNGKGAWARNNMHRHIETHLEGLSYPCNLCGKVSRSSNGLQKHISREHRNIN